MRGSVAQMVNKGLSELSAAQSTRFDLALRDGSRCASGRTLHEEQAGRRRAAYCLKRKARLARGPKDARAHRHVRCLMGLTGRPRDVPESLENAAMECRNGLRKGPTEPTWLRLKIVNVQTYVGHMTRAANEGKRHACQGLHKATVLAYGFSRTVPLTVDCHLS